MQMEETRPQPTLNDYSTIERSSLMSHRNALFLASLATILAFGCGPKDDAVKHDEDLRAEEFALTGRQMVQCKIVTSRFKQFCYVDETPSLVTASLSNDVSRTVTVASGSATAPIDIHLDLREIYRSFAAGGFVITGLRPYLKFTLDYTDSPECWSNGMHYDKISIQARVPGTGDFVELTRARVGAYDYDVPLTMGALIALWSTVDTPDNTTQFATEFRFRDLGRVPTDPLPPTRLPLTCNMTLANVRVGFEPVPIANDLVNLRGAVSQTDELITKATVLHGLYLNGQDGAMCGIAVVRRAVRAAANMGSNDSDDRLPLTFRNALKKAVEEAASLGAIDPRTIPDSSVIGSDGMPVKDYWQYYITNIDAIVQQCQQTNLSDYQVSTAPFISSDGTVINPAGKLNAEDFLRYVHKLKELMAGGWALALAGNLAVQQASELDWLIDPTILGRLQ
jgi:hypothetical protein